MTIRVKRNGIVVKHCRRKACVNSWNKFDSWNKYHYDYTWLGHVLSFLGIRFELKDIG